jgi:hypothetical protein
MSRKPFTGNDVDPEHAVVIWDKEAEHPEHLEQDPTRPF